LQLIVIAIHSVTVT